MRVNHQTAVCAFSFVEGVPYWGVFVAGVSIGPFPLFSAFGDPVAYFAAVPANIVLRYIVFSTGSGSCPTSATIPLANLTLHFACDTGGDGTTRCTLELPKREREKMGG